MFDAVAQPNSSVLTRDQFSQAVMLLNARVVPVIPEELNCCGCRIWHQHWMTVARRRVLRFLCRSSIVFNTEIVWFEVGMFAVVALSMVINVETVSRYRQTDAVYSEKLQAMHYVTMPCFVIEVIWGTSSSRCSPDVLRAFGGIMRFFILVLIFVFLLMAVSIAG